MHTFQVKISLLLITYWPHFRALLDSYVNNSMYALSQSNEFSNGRDPRLLLNKIFHLDNIVLVCIYVSLETIRGFSQLGVDQKTEMTRRLSRFA